MFGRFSVQSRGRQCFRNPRIFGVYAFLFAISCMGCERDPVIETMYIPAESIKVHITEDRPALVIVEYDWYFANGCESHHSTDTYWQGTVFYIHEKVSVPAASAFVSCEDAVILTTQHLFIGTLDIGTYAVNINDRVVAFEVLPRKESS